MNASVHHLRSGWDYTYLFSRRSIVANISKSKGNRNVLRMYTARQKLSGVNII